MVIHELEQILFEELGYAGKPGLLQGSEIPWPNGRAIPNIDSALFLKDTPLAYFSRFNDADVEQIRKLHQKVWSQSKAPLLFVILPYEIRIYNGYETTPASDQELDTPSRLLQRLPGLTDHLLARHKIQQQLVENNHYERIYLETGAFWDTTDGRKINRRNRADRQLVEGMGQMRKLLQGAGLSNHVAYTLLGRSIFIRYLEDRGVLTPAWIESITNYTATSYRDALNSRQVAYHLFEQLSRRFNGDLFPVEEEEKNVTGQHLQLLLRFLNREDLATGQLSLFHFDFEYIPIELISHIYDTFIEDQRESGAYYTPLPLADFVLEESMGADVIQPDMTVLDPACGSGIFLVGAFRRLIQAWHQKNGAPTPGDLCRILQNNIFGVDKNREAVRIAAFSLYLEILNHLSNDQIRDDSFRFPALKPRNLLDYDFFAEEVDKQFEGRKFDRIIGNMPWGRGTLTDKAQKWLDAHDYIVGSKQAAPAFMLRVPQFCKNEGEVALLAPVKGTILVTSDTHQAFRRLFFSTYHVRAIVNFAALVYELFPEAISPAAAFFYSSHTSETDNKVIYSVPKPSPLSQQLVAIVLDATEIKHLSVQKLLDMPFLWKVALWGNPRDATLIERLTSLPTLKQQADKLGWKMNEGFMAKFKGSDENKAIWLTGMPYLSPKEFSSYLVKSKVVVEDTVFHRPRSYDIYQAPLVLIHHSRCQAAFLNDGFVAYTSKMSGITSNSQYIHFLKWLTIYMNSPIAQYYHFLTSTSWAVERGTVIHKEYETMPFPIPKEDDPKFKLLLDYFEQFVELLNQDVTFFDTARNTALHSYQFKINKLVYELLNIHPVELQLIEDMLEYGIGFFKWSKLKGRKPKDTKAVQQPNLEELKTYAQIFIRAVTAFLRVKNQTLNATVYQNGAPLTVVSFTLVNLGETKPVQVITQSNSMRSKLNELDELLLERMAPSMYIRRHVRVYDGNQVSLVRPSEQRFWTQSQARADADAFLAELSS